MSWDPLDSLPPGEPEKSFPRGSCWMERHWLNVPGPFYAGMNDTCWTGRLCAPANIGYGEYQGDPGFFNEYVYRQPRTPAEVMAVVEAAWSDPYGGFACDGDRCWTPTAVRDWWRGRARIAEYVTGLAGRWGASDDEPLELEAAEGLLDYAAYLEGGLAHDLRRYLFRLEEGRYPEPHIPLPELPGL